ncbi:uncharacterized protein ACHE_50781A [Aspergillus chevalieri]|uniref:Uncharacterized protein n=1 Tax=Aspergillus chevalieri TaxID=182096 RepID=A0A7R7ZPG6_ASPCH|nr:uncharacterized protein ACHE_50781A [Aspergillus chevalieri]BCR89583.1 hypothetical protein ACHE_50781A [Aspergillus chevalieri]
MSSRPQSSICSITDDCQITQEERNAAYNYAEVESAEFKGLGIHQTVRTKLS